MRVTSATVTPISTSTKAPRAVAVAGDASRKRRPATSVISGARAFTTERNATPGPFRERYRSARHCTTRPTRRSTPRHQVLKTYFAAMAAGFHAVGAGSAGALTTVTGRAWTTHTGPPSRRGRAGAPPTP